MSVKELYSNIDGEILAEWRGDGLMVHTVYMAEEEDRLSLAKFIVNGPVGHKKYRVTTKFDKRPIVIFVDTETGSRDSDYDEEAAFEVEELWEI